MFSAIAEKDVEFWASIAHLMTKLNLCMISVIQNHKINRILILKSKCKSFLTNDLKSTSDIKYFDLFRVLRNCSYFVVLNAMQHLVQLLRVVPNCVLYTQSEFYNFLFIVVLVDCKHDLRRVKLFSKPFFMQTDNTASVPWTIVSTSVL